MNYSFYIKNNTKMKFVMLRIASMTALIPTLLIGLIESAELNRHWEYVNSPSTDKVGIENEALDGLHVKKKQEIVGVDQAVGTLVNSKQSLELDDQEFGATSDPDKVYFTYVYYKLNNILTSGDQKCYFVYKLFLYQGYCFSLEYANIVATQDIYSVSSVQPTYDISPAICISGTQMAQVYRMNQAGGKIKNLGMSLPPLFGNYFNVTYSVDIRCYKTYNDSMNNRFELFKKTLNFNVEYLDFEDIKYNKSIRVDITNVNVGYTENIFLNLAEITGNNLRLNFKVKENQSPLCPGISIYNKSIFQTRQYFDKDKHLEISGMLFYNGYLFTVLYEVYQTKFGDYMRLRNSLLLRISTVNFVQGDEEEYMGVNLIGENLVGLYPYSNDTFIIASTGDEYGTYISFAKIEDDRIVTQLIQQIYLNAQNCFMDSKPEGFFLYCTSYINGDSSNTYLLAKLLIRINPPELEIVKKFYGSNVTGIWAIKKDPPSSKMIFNSVQRFWMGDDVMMLKTTTKTEPPTVSIVRFEFTFDNMEAIGLAIYGYLRSDIDVCSTPSTTFLIQKNAQGQLGTDLVYSTTNFLDLYLYVKKPDTLSTVNPKIMYKCLPEYQKLIFSMRYNETNYETGSSYAIEELYILDGQKYDSMTQRIFFKQKRRSSFSDEVPYIGFGYYEDDKQGYLVARAKQGQNAVIENTYFIFDKNYPRAFIKVPNKKELIGMVCYYELSDEVSGRRLKEVRVGVNRLSDLQVTKKMDIDLLKLNKTANRTIKVEDLISIKGGVYQILMTPNPEWKLMPRIRFLTQKQDKNPGFPLSEGVTHFAHQFIFLAGGERIVVHGILENAECSTQFVFPIQMVEIFEVKVTNKCKGTGNGTCLAVLVLAKNRIQKGSIITLILNKKDISRCSLKQVELSNIDLNVTSVKTTSFEIGLDIRNNTFMLITYADAETLHIIGRVKRSKYFDDIKNLYKIFEYAVNSRKLGDNNINMDNYYVNYYPVLYYYRNYNLTGEVLSGFIVNLITVKANELSSYIMDLQIKRIYTRDVYPSHYSNHLSVICQKPIINTTKVTYNGQWIQFVTTPCAIELADSDMITIKFKQNINYITSQAGYQLNERTMSKVSIFINQRRSLIKRVAYGNEFVGILHDKANAFNSQQFLLVFSSLAQSSYSKGQGKLKAHGAHAAIPVDYNEDIYFTFVKHENHNRSLLVIYTSNFKWRIYEITKAELVYTGPLELSNAMVESFELEFVDSRVRKTVSINVKLIPTGHFEFLSPGLRNVLAFGLIFAIQIFFCVFYAIKRRQDQEKEKIKKMEKKAAQKKRLSREQNEIDFKELNDYMKKMK